MPRTKRPVSKAKAPRLPDGEEAKRRKDLDEIVEDRKQALDQRCEVEIKNIQLAFHILVSSMSPEMLNKTIGQLKSEQAHKERSVSSTSRRAVSQDDGYLTEGSAQDEERARRPRTARSATRHAEISTTSEESLSRTARGRRSRSAEVHARRTVAKSRRCPTATKTPAAHRTPASFKTPSAYKTPCYSGSAHNSFPPITPKVVPNTPMTVLRYPRQGEMVVSMSGSPLQVVAMQSSKDKPICNIPLHDGTMLSLQPEHMSQSNTFIPISLINSGVMRQIKTLRENLDTFVKLGEEKGCI